MQENCQGYILDDAMRPTHLLDFQHLFPLTRLHPVRGRSASVIQVRLPVRLNVSTTPAPNGPATANLNALKASLAASQAATKSPDTAATRSPNSSRSMRLAVAPNVSLIYLFNDYLGSSSVATDGTTGSVVSKQEFDPWGSPRDSSGTISQTDVNYTGQVKDSGTGLLYYHARYYDPIVGRFTSPDSIVPGMASGKGGAAASIGVDDKMELRGLTVDFHEPGFVSEIHNENTFTVQKGFWFQLSDKDRQKAKSPLGPNNPQNLNRYSYVRNNPVLHTDPTGHYDPEDDGVPGGVRYEGMFDRDYIRTVPHFWDELRNDKFTERQAYNTYSRGQYYTSARGSQIRYDPKIGLALVIDPKDDGVVTVFYQARPSSGWSPGWYEPGGENTTGTGGGNTGGSTGGYSGPETYGGGKIVYEEE